MKKPAVFLDRDGTLIEEVNYLSRVEDLRLYSYTEDSVKSLKDNGFLVIVVTNQSGIGRGIYSEADMHSIHEAIQAELGGAIDAFYFCPHLPDEGCKCRKPGVGMIEAAMAEFEIDMENSWVIGDKKLDIELGQAAQVSTSLVSTGYGKEHKAKLEIPPTVHAKDMGEAVQHIIASVATKVVV